MRLLWRSAFTACVVIHIAATIWATASEDRLSGFSVQATPSSAPQCYLDPAKRSCCPGAIQNGRGTCAATKLTELLSRFPSTPAPSTARKPLCTSASVSTRRTCPLHTHSNASVVTEFDQDQRAHGLSIEPGESPSSPDAGEQSSATSSSEAAGTSLPADEHHAHNSSTIPQDLGPDGAANQSSPQPPSPPHPAPPVEFKPRRRINLAAEAEGAAIYAANPGSRKPERAIDKDSDSFLRSDCATHKWLVVELSQVARVEEVEVTMKELYSCRPATLTLHCSRERPAHLLAPDPLPPLADAFFLPPWQLLGNFSAENRRGTQSFPIPTHPPAPLPWCKFLLLNIHSHHGSEPVFALNSLVAHGITAAQDLEMALSTLPAADPPPPDPDAAPLHTLPSGTTSPSNPHAHLPTSPHATIPQQPPSPTPAPTPGSGGPPDPHATPDPSHPPQAAAHQTAQAPAPGLRPPASDSAAAAPAAGTPAPATTLESGPISPGQVATGGPGSAGMPLATGPEGGGAQRGAGGQGPGAAPSAVQLEAQLEDTVASLLDLQAGGRGTPSVYEMMKREILGLKHNGTLLARHLRALNASLLELGQAAAAAEVRAAEAAARLQAAEEEGRRAVEAQVHQMLTGHRAEVQELLQRQEAALAAASRQATALLLQAAAAAGAAVYAVALPHSSRAFRQTVAVLCLLNCLVGLYLGCWDMVPGVVQGLKGAGALAGRGVSGGMLQLEVWLRQGRRAGGAVLREMNTTV